MNARRWYLELRIIERAEFLPAARLRRGHAEVRKNSRTRFFPEIASAARSVAALSHLAQKLTCPPLGPQPDIGSMLDQLPVLSLAETRLPRPRRSGCLTTDLARRCPALTWR
jgi:hypothetical protein